MNTLRLYPYQERAADWLATRRSALLSLAPGLGKGPVALSAAKRIGAKEVTVVCPLTLVGMWERERKRWWPEAVSRFQDEEPNPLCASWPSVFTVITYDYLRLHGLPRARTDLLIFDESVLLKNRKAARSRAAKTARRKAAACWMLSGAPTTRFLDDLYMQVHTLEPKQYSSYWRFAFAYTLVQQSVWGMQVTANAPGIEPRLKADLAPILYTYNYADLARDEPERAIPEWAVETRQVPLPVSWWTIYKQMQDTFLASLPSGNVVLAPIVLTQLLRLVQLASHPALLDDATPWSAGGKLSAIPGLLEELPQPCILWTNFVATAKELAQRLKAPMLIGDTPANERTRIVAEFQAGKHPVLIAHPGVGRFGLTLTRGRSMIFVERSFNADFYYQALYRCRRIGTTEPPHVVILEATGPDGQATVDRAIGSVLDYRKEHSDALTTARLREALV